MSEPSRDLLQALSAIDNVTRAELLWGHEWPSGMEVRITLADMDWQARAQSIGIVERYLEDRAAHFGASIIFEIPEPVEFTHYKIASTISARLSR